MERPPLAIVSVSLSNAPWLVSIDEALAAPHAGDAAMGANVDAARRAFVQQHARRSCAPNAAPSQKSWPECFFVEGDAVLLHQRDEIMLRVARQRRAGEVRIGGEKRAGSRR